MKHQIESLRSSLVFGFVALSLSLSGCGMKTVHNDPALEIPPASDIPALSDTTETPKVQAPAIGLLAPVENASQITEPQIKFTVAPSAHPPVEKSAGVPAEKALGWLKNGNTRYIKGFVRKDGQAMKDIEKLSSGQSPHTIVLSCSDSRVPPEIVFDQKLGEIFVIRNAGEVPDQAAIASIEYAVAQLGSHLLVVMGHSSCGAVKEALATLDGEDAGSPALNALVRDIHPHLISFKGHPQYSSGYKTESWAQAKGVAKDLLSRSEIIRSKVESGDLKIQAALYDLGHGKVDFE